MIGLLVKGHQCLQNLNRGDGRNWAADDLFLPFKGLTRDLFVDITGVNHALYQEMNAGRKEPYESNVKTGIRMLETLKEEIELGYLEKIESKITGEVFTDFLEMGEHLLSEGFLEAAAVMFGGVLEGQLRKLSSANGISLTYEKNGSIRFQSAETLNSELFKKEVYPKTEKNLISLLIQTRNYAAHTDERKVQKHEVERMLIEVTRIINQYSI